MPDILAFNRGIVSDLALARKDVERVSLSAETQTNWMPRKLGSMMLRPGYEYIVSTRDGISLSADHPEALHFPFIFSKSDTAIVQVILNGIRVILNEAFLGYPYVTTAVTNGLFSSGVTGWTDNDDTGATSSGTGTSLSLVGTGFAYARRYQQITVASADQNIEHCLRFEVGRGKADLKISGTLGDGSYLDKIDLGVGEYFFSFTPTGDFYIEISSATKYATLVNQAILYSQYYSASEITANFKQLLFATSIASNGLNTVRGVQSGEIVYFSDGANSLNKLERHGTRSWGLADYAPEDGPFLPYNSTGTTLTPNAISGDIVLTASHNLFKSEHVGALFNIDSVGQRVQVNVTAEDQFSSEIRVTGVNRPFFVELAGTWTATVTLQRSIGAPGSWTDVTTYTTNGNNTYNDGLDNQVVYYRVGVKTGDFTSGTVELALNYAQGSISGICRVVTVTNATTATAIVLRDFGGVQATNNWREGAWSDHRGYPSAVELYQGRLWWAGKQNIWASESDAYETFDPDLEGDSRPISRSIGYGTVDNINWMVGASRLIIGTDSRELSAQSSADDEPLTQDNFSLKDASTNGSERISPVKLDKTIIYASGYKVFQLAPIDGYEYEPIDLSSLVPDIGSPSIVALGIQRKPDTRVHVVLSDGTTAIFVYDSTEGVQGWVKTQTDGTVSDVVVFPGTEEDTIYYHIERTIDGTNHSYLEKWAKESECQGGSLNKQADSFSTYTGASTSTITGLSHLEGESVTAWADGKKQGPFTVSSGQIILTTPASNVVAGLTYTASFKSTKLGDLTEREIINQIGLVLKNTHASGIQFGDDFSHLESILKADLPKVSGFPDTDHVFPTYELDKIPVNGKWANDSRLCLQADAPLPCTVLAAIVELRSNRK